MTARFVPRFAGPVKGGPAPRGEVPSELGQVVPARDEGVVLLSAGKREDFDAERMRRVGGAVVKWMRTWKVAQAGIDLRGESAFGGEAVGALCEGLHLADFSFDRLRNSEPRAREPAVTIIADVRPQKAARDQARIARICAGVKLARSLGHEPPNLLNPVTLARRATAMARKAGLGCRVLDERQMERLGMGALLAAGRGSVVPPRLIVLEHRVRAGARPVVLVGKAVTFDTGGYSLKTKDGIVGMKYDKCGGMAVIGAMQAVAASKLSQPVVGIVAAAENMISGDAYRPDDIVRTMAGKTVQIVSADAEGRMVLCDALSWAQRQYRPRCIIDLATLTGGIVVALGKHAAGIFANDSQLEQSLIESGRRTGERLWPMPMWDDYFQLIKGDDSDLKNSAGREAHAICGAIFLKQFVDRKIPWAHLDIAGVAAFDTDQPYCPKGATGFGVRLLLDYLERLR